ncbi:MAG: VanZ family protein [Acidobacteria bacterium]|nr:VanZ family protein [Acidobacteriota bacterium]
MKWLTSLYALFLSAVVFLAAQGEYQFLFRFVRSMPLGDKLGHFFLMGLASLLVNLALSCRTFSALRKRFLLGTWLVLLLVTVEELTQLFLAYRSFDLVDLLFDAAGIFLFGRLAYYWSNRRPTGNSSTITAHAEGQRASDN